MTGRIEEGLEAAGRRLRGMLGRLYRRGRARRLFRDRKGVPEALACLHPGERLEAVEEQYHIRKLGISLLACAAAGVVLAGPGICWALDPGRQPVSALERPGYLEGDRSQQLYVQGEAGEGRLSLTLGERQYTQKEAQAHLQEVMAELDSVIRGENQSLDRVEYPLNLVREWPDYGISLEWYSGTPEVLDSRGVIADSHVEGSCLVELRALLRCGQYESTYRCTANVYPRKREAEDAFLALADASLREQEARTAAQASFALPEEIGGEEVTYYLPQDTSGWSAGCLLLALAVLLYFWRDERLLREARGRDAQMMADYPAIVSRLTILLGAGMSVPNALEKMTEDYLARRERGGRKRYAYEEMAVAVRETNSGIPQAQAYERLGKRCRLMPYRKLAGLLAQAVRMGNKRLAAQMKEEVSEALEERRQRARKAGEEAGTKMLGPMMLLLAVTVLIVLFPALQTFGV